ncbi:DUF1616 domain-containing protein [Halobellus limi]|uniref:DUF1616 domain-containing protein n=1 Tax=Halobellus limi TaxID=699433 RepID=A0A1H6BCU9_9EURY|nr:DUF1616 domain-containing protein [Halobellus limi]QCC49291.1 DUF1616 domain-containing protein [Halobellus limi]SEG58673.1 Uncharacterized membrane protein [Halobellus limi]
MSRNHASGGTFATWLDLVVTVVLALLTTVPVLITGGLGPVELLRVPLGFVFVFFLPGYAIQSALYPASSLDAHDQFSARMETGETKHGPTPLERLVLSVGLSLVTVPLVGLVWNFTPWGIAIQQVLGSLAGIVVVAVVVGAYRRAKLGPEDRFHLPLERIRTENWPSLDGGTTREKQINIAVALLVVFAVVSVGTAIATPKDGEEYTELYLLTEDPESGALTASEYPRTLSPGEPRDVHVGIGNHETHPATYTVVVKLQKFETVTGERNVVEETELDRFSATIESGQTERIPRTITPDASVTGQNLRLVFLLYEGTPAPDPSVSNAYREVHLWVTVSP